MDVLSAISATALLASFILLSIMLLMSLRISKRIGEIQTEQTKFEEGIQEVDKLITEYEKSNGEIPLDILKKHIEHTRNFQEMEKQISCARSRNRKNIAKISLTMTVLAIMSSILSFISEFPNEFRILIESVQNFILSIFARTVHAQEVNFVENAAASSATFVGVFIIVVMVLAFLWSLKILFSASNDDNQRKIEAADNICKTFGGFFVGFATSLFQFSN